MRKERSFLHLLFLVWQGGLSNGLTLPGLCGKHSMLAGYYYKDVEASECTTLSVLAMTVKGLLFCCLLFL